MVRSRHRNVKLRFVLTQNSRHVGGYLMVKLTRQKEWNYAATPGFVVRFRDEVFQKRHIETEEWVDSVDPTLLRQITEDGRPLSEKEAEEAFLGMQKRHQKYKKPAK